MTTKTSGNGRGTQRGGTMLDMVFALDATGSMDPYIEGIVMALMDFIDILESSGLDVMIGLVIFRDELCGEETATYDLTTDFAKIRAILSETKAWGGGDEPESALPALRYALNLKEFRPGAQKFLLLVTDASCHNPEGGYSSKDVLTQILENNAVFFACSPAIEPYKTFVNATRGILFPISGSMSSTVFKDVMLSVARATVKTMRMDGPGAIDPVALDDLRKTLRRG